MNIKFSALLEEVYGVNVVAYHRTKSEDIISGILEKGIIPGEGMLYGQGFYATYDLDSQLKSNMKNKYGNIILKVFIKAYKFLIFDYDIAKKIYKDKYTLIDQLENMKLLKYIKYLDDIKYYSTTLKRLKYSSDIAYQMYKTESSIISSINGIIFTGRNDGKVIVAYEPNAIVPMAFSEDDGKSWNKISNKQALQRYFLNKEKVFNKENIKTKLTYEELTNLVNSNKIALSNAMKILFNLKDYFLIASAGKDWKEFDYDKGLDALIKFKNGNIIANAGQFWKNFDYDKGLDALIELGHTNVIYQAGDFWKEFDYKKGLNALIDLEDGNNIYKAGTNWKEFNYEKALDALIDLKDYKNIFYAGDLWKEYDYKKGLKSLKELNNEYYERALKDWKGKY
jgi:hypothetical protein